MNFLQWHANSCKLVHAEKLTHFKGKPVRLCASNKVVVSSVKALQVEIKDKDVAPKALLQYTSHFARSADRFANNNAVQQGSVSLTYKDLDRRSTLIANRLATLGVKSEILVAVVAERSPEIPAGEL